MIEIKGYHAHIYFDEQSSRQAEQLCRQAGELFTLEVGRHHRKPVGPHPMWSCQLAFAPDMFSEVIPWLACHRNGLTVFIHPETGDDLKDHTEFALWMGSIEPLKLDIFE